VASNGSLTTICLLRGEIHKEMLMARQKVRDDTIARGGAVAGWERAVELASLKAHNMIRERRTDEINTASALPNMAILALNDAAAAVMANLVAIPDHPKSTI
jgi:hypothetical protein